jgi:hypothetical protein
VLGDARDGFVELFGGDDAGDVRQRQRRPPR